jgi:alpha-mannosidase
MHDEANTHYSVMIDQTAFGHEFLWEQFRVISTIGWQIDPFGHSATQGSLLSSGVDFDALYMTRIDHQEYDIREKNKSLEFIWRPSPSRGKYSQVFTGVIQKNYLAPEEVHFGKSVHYASFIGSICVSN